VKLLLDTSAFLWFISGDARFSKVARLQVEDEANQVFLSSVSSWEIAVKHSLGKLTLPAPVVNYVTLERERQGFYSLALLEADVAHLSKLPNHHRDPFDRILICQCIENGMRFVTSDPLIAAYPVPICW
jgi:PIN domain nuclease of toxin-antitoxin system